MSRNDLIPAQARVVRTLNKGPVEESRTEEDITLMVRPFITDAAKVTVNMGMTISLGRFESARIDVGLTMPCYVEEVDEVHAYAAKWVEEKTLAEAELAREFATKRTAEAE